MSQLVSATELFWATLMKFLTVYRVTTVWAPLVVRVAVNFEPRCERSMPHVFAMWHGAMVYHRILAFANLGSARASYQLSTVFLLILDC